MTADDKLAINAAKSELREGYNRGDVERVLAVFADAFIDMTHNEPGFYGPEAKDSLRMRLKELFARYAVTMVPIVSDIGVFGGFAFDWGWYEMTLKDRTSGEEKKQPGRYCELWAKFPDGKWRVTFYISAAHLPNVMLEERYEEARRALAGD
jgi:ketosteroid isomerase-like protein